MDNEFSQFLSYCKTVERKPSKKSAEIYLYGDYGSIEETEEPIPDWYWELPDE